MAEAPVSPAVTIYLDPAGNPVEGYLRVRLNTDGTVIDRQLSSTFVEIPLTNGVDSATYWPNSLINPSGTYYIRAVYTTEGQEVAAPAKVTI